MERQQKAEAGAGADIRPLAEIPVRQSLVAQAADLIRRDGLAGRWPGELPGERALALELQLSRSTLRLALQQLEREGFLALRARRRSFVGRVAERPASASRVVVILTWDASRRFPFSRILDMEEMHALLQGAGLQLKIVNDLPLESAGRVSVKLESLHRRLQPVCWILFSCPPVIHRWFFRRRIPAIISGSRHPAVKIPNVDFDNAAMARHAVGKLLAMGHRRIGLLVPDSGLLGDQASETGFEAACAAHPGGDVAHALYKHDRSPARLAEQVQRFAADGGFPAALVVTHYWYAITALTWLLGHGVRVPEDVSLVCLRIDRDLDYAVPSIHGYDMDGTLHSRKLARLVIRFAHTGQVTAESELLLGRERPGASLGPGSAGRRPAGAHR